MFTDQQKVDIRRYCGYPAYGAAPDGKYGVAALYPRMARSNTA